MPNGGDQLSLYKALSVGRPWVLGIQNQVVSYCGTGICDALLSNSVSALEPFRYATCLFAWTLAANGDNITIPTQEERDIFTSGVGEPIPGGWWIQTISDTDLFKSGAPVDRGFMFLVTGLTADALDVFQRGNVGTSADDPKFYAAFLQESEDGPGYGFLMQKFHINYTAIQFTFGDTGCSYRLGTLANWPHWGGPRGAQTVWNGLVATPGMYLPFTTAVCIGSRDDVKQLTVTLTTGQGATVQNNPAGPTTVALNGFVYAPVRVTTVGYIVCVPFENYCGIPALTPDEVILLRQRLGLQPVAVIPGGVMQPGMPVPPPPGPPIGPIAYQAGQ